MTPTQIEAQWPAEVVEAWHWIKTHCRHWAIVGNDWQTLDELTKDKREIAERHMVVLCLHGLVEFSQRLPKKEKPGRCGQPNFRIRPLYDRRKKQ